MKDIKISTDKWKSITKEYSKHENFDYKIFVAMTIDKISESFDKNKISVKYDNENELIVCYINPNENGFENANRLYIAVVDNFNFYKNCLLEIVDGKQEHLKISPNDKMLVMEKVVQITVDKVKDGIKNFSDIETVKKNDLVLNELVDKVEKW